MIDEQVLLKGKKWASPWSTVPPPCVDGLLLSAIAVSIERGTHASDTGR